MRNVTFEPPMRHDLSGARVLVMGLGRAGSAVAGFLLEIGACVAAFDDNPAALSSVTAHELRRAGMRVVRRPESFRPDWTVVSPGIRDDNETLGRVRRQCPRVVGELDLASRLRRGGKLVAVTGTNGKSTTVAMLGGILRRAGWRVFVGGNLAPGEPLSAGLDRDWDCYVVEASSFQLERARWFAPDIAVITNITVDHLDRHASGREYAECKFRILDRQTRDQWSVLNRDDEVVMRAAERGNGRRVLFSMRARPRGGAWLSRGGLWFGDRRLARTEDITAPGRHNVQNALVAVCCAQLLGVASGPIRTGLREFIGLPHRLERVRELDGVTYVNNSMCTNPPAGVASLRAFGRKVVLITGGKEKGLGYRDYAAEIGRRSKWVVLMGESGPGLARSLKRHGFSRFTMADNMDAALDAARRKARPGDIVLFSPAFASFDQFRDFQDRGEVFRRKVARLA